jgi:hypothetical protein
MKKLKEWFKWFWSELGKPIEYPDGHNPFNEPIDFYKASKPKDNNSWCPFCGYSGSADNLRCHLLNDHKK